MGLKPEFDENPLVSIIVPAHNAGLTLYDCLKSLREQTYQNLEIIVVNDGSSDETGDVAAWAARSDPRVRVITHHCNGGQGAARATGVAAARGDYIAYCDADDTCGPNRIANQVWFLENRYDVDVAYTHCTEVRENVKIPIRYQYSRKIYAGRECINCGSSMHRTWLLKCCTWDSTIDTGFWMQAHKNGATFATCGGPGDYLYYRRPGTESLKRARTDYYKLVREAHTRHGGWAGERHRSWVTKWLTFVIGLQTFADRAIWAAEALGLKVIGRLTYR